MAYRSSFSIFYLAMFLSLAWPAAAGNIILLVGDGMGPEHVRAGGMFLHGQPGTLCFEAMPVRGSVTTWPAGGGITDSAAAATAMATGVKVNNSVVSERTPGNGSDLPTILEQAKAAGLSTGLVTTSFILDATPAAFAAHAGNRYERVEIAQDMFALRPDVLLGGGNVEITNAMINNAGYLRSTSRSELLMQEQMTTATQICGLYGTNYMPYEADGPNAYPHLHEMARVALNKLAQNPRGFFLMIEGGNIDHAAHENNIVRQVHELVEFTTTTQLVLDWAEQHPDTLVIVTADHETGGLRITRNNGAGEIPTVTWSSTWHTSVPVNVYAQGPDSDLLAGSIDNTRIYTVMKKRLDGILAASVPLSRWEGY